MIACPKWDDPDAFRFGNHSVVLGPSTDGHGQFAGFPITGFRIHNVPSSQCTVYPEYVYRPNAAFVADLNGLYQIVASDESLPARARVIQAAVTPRPQRVKAGLVESIQITKGWGGAAAEVSVLWAHRTATETVHLDWEGNAHIRVPVQSDQASLGKVKVVVHFRLGQHVGRSLATFSVVR